MIKCVFIELLNVKDRLQLSVDIRTSLSTGLQRRQCVLTIAGFKRSSHSG